MKVAKYEQEQEQERLEQAQRDEERIRRAQEQNHADQERAARRQRELDAQAAREQKSAADAARAQSNTDAAAAEKQAALQQLAAEQYALRAAAIAAQSARTGSSKAPSSDSSSLGAIADPFAEHGDGRLRALERPTISASIVDPFQKAEPIVDPFATEHQNRTGAETEREKAIYEGSAKAIDESTGRAVTALQKDITEIEAHAGKTMSVATANKMVQEIRDTQSVIKSVSRVLSTGQYAVLFKNIATAESLGKKDEATGTAIKQIASDLLHQDVVTNGMTAITLRLFGERVGPLLVRAAAPTLAGGGILLDSEKTGRDSTEVIHDVTGKVSLSEKQSALMDEWRGYDRLQTQAKARSDTGLPRALWVDTNIVYNQCLEAKATCDRWKTLLDHQ